MGIMVYFLIRGNAGLDHQRINVAMSVLKRVQDLGLLVFRAPGFKLKV